MKSTIILLLLLLPIYVRHFVRSENVLDAKHNVKGDCAFKCTRERRPVCAAGERKKDYKMFENSCEMQLFNCKSDEEYKKVNFDNCFHANAFVDVPEYLKSKLKSN